MNAFAQALGIMLGEIFARIDWAALVPVIVQAAREAMTTTAAQAPPLPEESVVQKEINDAIQSGQAPGPDAHLP